MNFKNWPKTHSEMLTISIIEQFIYAKMPPHLQKSINQAHLENGTYEQIATHLEKEIELNGLEAPDELQVNTVSQQPTNTNADRPNQRATTVKNKAIIKLVSSVENTTRTKWRWSKISWKQKQWRQ